MKIKLIQDKFYGSEKDLDDKIKFEVAYNQAVDNIVEYLEEEK